MSTDNLVREFHEKFGHPIAQNVNAGTEKLRRLRVNLILEEAIEFANACGYHVYVTDGNVSLTSAWDEPNLVEMADGLGDLRYVIDGANLVFGFPQVAILQEIHNSNMSKLGTDGKPILREDGKVLKGPNYFKPNIAAILGV